MARRFTFYRPDLKLSACPGVEVTGFWFFMKYVIGAAFAFGAMVIVIDALYIIFGMGTVFLSAFRVRRERLAEMKKEREELAAAELRKKTFDERIKARVAEYSQERAACQNGPCFDVKLKPVDSVAELFNAATTNDLPKFIKDAEK